MKTFEQPGTFLAVPVGKGKKQVMLDGFLSHGPERQDRLLVFVHGMHSNFYRSRLKKTFMRQGERYGFDVLSFNTQGAEYNVNWERFTDCLKDLDAVLAYARRRGYRRFVLAGHSTGCQKITYYQARRNRRDVEALINLAPGDDYAIWRRDVGSRASYWLKRARQRVAEGRGKELMPRSCLGFSAKRFLSIADRSQTEAKIFDYGGRLTHFSRIREPVMVLFGSNEEYACIPVEEMGEILRNRTHSTCYQFTVIQGGDHGFHDHEAGTVRQVYRWLTAHQTEKAR